MYQEKLARLQVTDSREKLFSYLEALNVAEWKTIIRDSIDRPDLVKVAFQIGQSMEPQSYLAVLIQDLGVATRRLVGNAIAELLVAAEEKPGNTDTNDKLALLSFVGIASIPIESSVLWAFLDHESDLVRERVGWILAERETETGEISSHWRDIDLSERPELTGPVVLALAASDPVLSARLVPRLEGDDIAVIQDVLRTARIDVRVLDKPTVDDPTADEADVEDARSEERAFAEGTEVGEESLEVVV